jgi:hypothetical protein
VCEDTAVGVEVMPDIVVLMLGLHEPQAGPVSLCPLTRLPGGHVLLICNAVPLPPESNVLLADWAAAPVYNTAATPLRL